LKKFGNLNKKICNVEWIRLTKRDWIKMFEKTLLFFVWGSSRPMHYISSGILQTGILRVQSVSTHLLKKWKKINNGRLSRKIGLFSSIENISEWLSMKQSAACAVVDKIKNLLPFNWKYIFISRRTKTIVGWQLHMGYNPL
jgi:hypothetical protein